MNRIEEIVDFWLQDAAHDPEAAWNGRERWYYSTPEADAEISERFGADIEAACRGDLDHWAESAEGALALVILLDQFTRNVYRNTPQAYIGDERSWRIADAAVRNGTHTQLPVAGRHFLYSPFHHSEVVAEQDRVVELLTEMRDTSPPQWRAFAQRSIDGHGKHRDIVAQFGRFPHRNQVLGRESTPEEIEFLEERPEGFGQGGQSASAKP